MEITDAQMRKIAQYAADEVWARMLDGKKASTRLIECSDAETSKKDPSGRGKHLTTHDHVKWIGAAVQDVNEKLDDVLEVLKND